MIQKPTLNDTKIMDISIKEQKIISILLKYSFFQSSRIHKALVEQGEDISLVTVKRALSKMVEKKLLKIKGSGRSVSYELSVLGRVFSEVNANEYVSIEPDKRYGLSKYNFDFFPSFPKQIFTENELENLNKETIGYRKKVKNISPVIQKKELERLVIELSWKSSKIEGNTYTLLDTENLILKNQPAKGKTKEETQMILNHKNAFNFAYKNRNLFKKPAKKNLERLHYLLVKDMNVMSGIRKNPVGISGSIYRPLDNVYQITEATELLFSAINQMKNPYDKSLLALLGISYIQPFEDGNKRTSRIMADAILLAENCASLSYRSVDEKEYRAAILTFYELNTITPFKKIFIEQYNFAAKNYLVK